jgi:hypothetical protein
VCYKMTNNKRFRLTLFPFTLLLCLAIMTTAFIGFQYASDNGTLYIADIEGDRSVLDDVSISGVLQDRYHGTKFEIRNEEVKQKFINYESNEAFALEMSQPILGNVLIEDGINYSYSLEYAISPYANSETSIKKEVDEYGQKYEERTRTADMVDVYVDMRAQDYQSKKYVWDRVRFSPDAYIKSDAQDFKKTERVYYNETGSIISKSNEPVGALPERRARVSISNNAFVILDGSVYFTLLSTSDFRGTSGIFKIEEFSRTWMTEEGDRAQYGKIKTVTTFSLDEHSMTVLGLKAINNKLVLILLEDGILKMRLYNPDSGKMIDELEVIPLSEAELAGIFLTFIQGNRLNISISEGLVQNSESSETSSLLVSTQVDDEIRLLHVVEDLDLDNDESLLYSVDEVYEVNGKLFVFAYVMRGKEQRQYPYQDLEPKHYLMFVYQDGKLLYKGELMNDSDEDYIADRQRVQTFSGGYGQYNYQHRQIRAVEVRGR